MACGLGADAEEEVGVLEWQLDQVARGLDGGVLAEDVGVAGGWHRALRGFGAVGIVRLRRASKIGSETDTDTATVAIGGGGEVGGRNLAVGPNPCRLAPPVLPGHDALV